MVLLLEKEEKVIVQYINNFPSFAKEGKVKSNNALTFSSSLRRSTPDGTVRGEVVDF
jgi:hypothetical protein